MVIKLGRSKYLAITSVCRNRNYRHLFGPFWLFDLRWESNRGDQ